MRKQQLQALCLAIAFMLLLQAGASAQQASPSTVFKDWTFVTEKAMVDVFYRVVECKGRNEVHLRVFNDLPVDREIRFTIEITNTANSEKLAREVVLQATSAARIVPECADDKLGELKIALPKGFDPATLAAKATVHTRL